MSNNINFHFLLKYIIIGDSAVGKSNLLLKYVHNKFNDDYQATIGVEFGAKNIEIDKKIFRIQIWDTAGQENFRSITRAYYKNSVCALVVYDISSKITFNNVQSWIEDCRAQSPRTILLVLVGNKTDLEEKREVETEEGKSLAEKNGMLFYETSALNGSNVENIFNASAKEIAKKIKERYYDVSSENCGIKIGLDPDAQRNSVLSGDGNAKKIDNGCCS